MAKYDDFLYGTDTYGERVRNDGELRVVNLGSWVRQDGVRLARFRVSMRDIAEDYPVGSRIVVMRGSSWYPDVPGFNQPVPDPFGYITDSLTVLYSGEVLAGVNGAPPTITGGYRVINESMTGPVPINSVLYVRMFVQEPGPTDEDGEPVYLPWDIRGSAFCVMAGMYGGERAAVTSLPVTYYTGGDPYGFVDEESTTYKFMSVLGLAADTVSTDGSLMVDGPTRLHPNLVVPHLLSFGLTDAERQAFSDAVLSARLKRLLFVYRELQSSRGTSNALTTLSEVMAGYSVDVSTVVENSLTTLGDAYPRGVSLDCFGVSVASGFTVSGQAHWSAACSLPYSPVPTDPPPWGDEWVSYNAVDYFHDSWEQYPDAADVWIDRWDQLDLPGTALRPPVPLTEIPELTDQNQYVQHIEWAHALTFEEAGSGWVGTRSVGDVPVTAYCSPISGGETFRLRTWAWCESPAQASAEILFLDQDGAVIDVVNADVSLLAQVTTVVAASGTAHADARWVAWRLHATALTPGVIYFSATELRNLQEDLFSTVPSVERELWERPYRNPRSVVVAVHSPRVEDSSISSVIVEDLEAIVGDPVATMEATPQAVIGSVRALDVLTVDKLSRVIPDYLPHSVSCRVLAGFDREYLYRYPIDP